MKSNVSKLYHSTIVAALGGLLFGFDTAVISGTTGDLQNYFKLTEAMLGFTVATALLGTMAGSLAVGRPTDLWGRKRVLLMLAVFYLISAIGSGLAWDLYSFWFFRFLGGIAVGGASVVSPMYIAEIAPAEMRGRLVGWQQFNVCFGICLAYISNYVVALCPLIADDPASPMAQWRWMLLMMAVPALAFLVLLFRIPESPRWLVERKRFDEARRTLDSLGCAQTDETLAEIVDSMHGDFDAAHAHLWRRSMAIPIITALMLAVFNQFSGINALLYYAPKVFTMGGSDTKTALLQSVPIGIMLVIGTMIGLVLIDRLGRRKLLMAGSVGMAAALGGVGYVFSRMQPGESVSGSIMWLFIAYLLFFGPSTGAVIWVYISEIFPNRVRAKGQALGSFAVWVSCALVSQAFPPAAAHPSVGPARCFYFFAICMLVQAVFVWKVMPETRGVSLEALQKKLGID
jgi:sugar porter (SP) family MFS transporter